MQKVELIGFQFLGYGKGQQLCEPLSLLYFINPEVLELVELTQPDTVLYDRHAEIKQDDSQLEAREELCAEMCWKKVPAETAVEVCQLPATS